MKVLPSPKVPTNKKNNYRTVTVLSLYAMFLLKPFMHHHQPPLLLSKNPNPTTIFRPPQIPHQGWPAYVVKGEKKNAKLRRLVVVACQGEGKEKGQRKGFLSLEEAGLVEISGLSTHERFLCRLTISSLNLLRVISEQEGLQIEELNAGRVCDWFLKDKLKREQDMDSAVLQWDDSDMLI